MFFGGGIWGRVPQESSGTLLSIFNGCSIGTHELIPPCILQPVVSFIRDPGLLTSALGPEGLGFRI